MLQETCEQEGQEQKRTDTNSGVDDAGSSCAAETVGVQGEATHLECPRATISKASEQGCLCSLSKTATSAVPTIEARQDETRIKVASVLGKEERLEKRNEERRRKRDQQQVQDD